MRWMRDDDDVREWANSARERPRGRTRRFGRAVMMSSRFNARRDARAIVRVVRRSVSSFDASRCSSRSSRLASRSSTASPVTDEHVAQQSLKISASLAVLAVQGLELALGDASAFVTERYRHADDEAFARVIESARSSLVLVFIKKSPRAREAHHAVDIAVREYVPMHIVAVRFATVLERVSQAVDAPHAVSCFTRR